MDAYRATLFVHLFATVLLVGQALFWAIMYVALRQQFDPTQTGQYLQILKRSRWPHVVIPYSLRLPLPAVGWATIALLVLTGACVIALTAVPQSALWWSKMTLFVALLVVQGLLIARASAALIFTNLILTLFVVTISALMIRS